MSLFNIHDHRTNDKATTVDIVFEVNCKDWENLGLPRNSQDWIGWTPRTSIYGAFMRVGSIKGMVDLYIYDAGKIEEDFAQISWIHPDLDEKPFDPTTAKQQDLIKVF